MNPILAEIGTVFIPVRDVATSRDWYCQLFDLPADGQILFGHLYVVPLDGPNLVLDSKIFSERNVLKTPLFHLNTTDIHQAYAHMEQRQIDIVTPIEHDHWFNFKDPDGNVLMMCQC